MPQQPQAQPLPQRWPPSAQRSPAHSGGSPGFGAAAGVARDPFHPAKQSCKHARTGPSRHRPSSQQQLQQLVELQQQQLLQLHQLLILQQSQQLSQQLGQQPQTSQSQQAAVLGMPARSAATLTDCSIDQVAALLQRQLLQPGAPNAGVSGGATVAAGDGGLVDGLGGSGGVAFGGLQFFTGDVAAEQRAAAAAAFGGLGSSFAGMGLGGGEGSGGGLNSGGSGLAFGGVAGLQGASGGLLPASLHGAGSPLLQASANDCHGQIGVGALFGGTDGLGSVGAFTPAPGFGGGWPPPPPPLSPSGSAATVGSLGPRPFAATHAANAFPRGTDSVLPAVLAAAWDAAALEPAPVVARGGLLGDGEPGAGLRGRAWLDGGSLSTADPVDAAPAWHPLSGAGPKPSAVVAPVSSGRPSAGEPPQPGGDDGGGAAVSAEGGAAAPMDVGAKRAAPSSAPKTGRGPGETGIKRKAPADSATPSAQGSAGRAEHEAPAPEVAVTSRRRRGGGGGGGGASSGPQGSGGGASPMAGETTSGSSSGAAGEGSGDSDDGGDGAVASCANSSVAGASQQAAPAQFGSTRGLKSSRVERHPGLTAPRPSLEAGAPAAAAPAAAATGSEEQALLLLSRLQLPVAPQPDPAAAATAAAGGGDGGADPPGAAGAAQGLPSELRAEYERRVEAVREALAELRRFELMHAAPAEGGGAEGAGAAGQGS
jgi:hypothetical protein